MCALTAVWSVYCLVSITKQSQPLQIGLRLRERNAIITSKWKGSYDSDRKCRSEWERLSCRKLPMDQHVNCSSILPKVSNFINHENQGRSNAPVQFQARFNRNFEKNSFLTFVYFRRFFVTKEWQYRKKV